MRSPPHPPPVKSKGVRFMVATGGFQSHKPTAPFHESQTAEWLYGGALFLEGGVAGPSWQSSDLREPSARLPQPHMDHCVPGALVCAGQILPPLLGASPAPFGICPQPSCTSAALTSPISASWAVQKPRQNTILHVHLGCFPTMSPEPSWRLLAPLGILF